MGKKKKNRNIIKNIVLFIYAEIGRGETVAGADCGTRRRVRVIGVDVGQQSTHHCRDAGT